MIINIIILKTFRMLTIGKLLFLEFIIRNRVIFVVDDYYYYYYYYYYNNNNNRR